jgi:hypothetical protein
MPNGALIDRERPTIKVMSNGQCAHLVLMCQFKVMRVIGTAGFTMRDPSVMGEAQVEASGQDSGDQLDKAGQSILRLLQKAAGVAEENSRYEWNALRRSLGSGPPLALQLRHNEIVVLDPNFMRRRVFPYEPVEVRAERDLALVSLVGKDHARLKYRKLLSLARAQPVKFFYSRH